MVHERVLPTKTNEGIMIKDDFNSQDLWMPLEDYPKYEVNRSGQIRNTKTGNLLSIQRKPTGLKYASIHNDHGNNIRIHIDETVAKAFLPKIDNDSNTVLLHLDGDKNNCCVDNLAWVEDDNAEKVYYSSHNVHKPKEYFTFYPLLEYPDSIYEINKMGQIRNKTTHKLMKGAIKEGYLVYSLHIHGKTAFRYAHIMVARQFIPNPENKPLVNHIDEDRGNPCIDNLEWVTASENSRYGTCVSKANLGRHKTINEYDIHGKYIRSWKSKKALSDFFSMLYPTNRCFYAIDEVLRFNSQNSLKKKAFADRVFAFYTDNRDDLSISHVHKIRHKNGNYIPTLDGINVPEEYLVNETDIPEYLLTVLKRLPSSDLGFSSIQKEALYYVIECVETLEKRKIDCI